MTLKKAKITLGSLLVTAIVLTSPSTTWGKEKARVIAIENKCGLEVKVPQKSIDLGNLNPGDSKETTIQLSNKGTNDITLFIRTNIQGETTLNGGYLADIMDFTISSKKDTIAEASFRGVADQGNILIGTLKSGASKMLDLATFLPGEGTGNEYQGAYMKVSWTFITQCSSGEAGGGNDKDKEVIEDDPNNPTDNPKKPPEEITIEDELVPLGEDDPDIPGKIEIPVEENELPLGDGDTDIPDNSDLIIEDESVPFGDLKMPKTGQLASVYFYGTGALLVTLGVSRKKQ